MAPAALAHIFISYSRVDTLFVDRLDTALTGRGFELLIDRRDIHHFKDWWAEIELLISSSDIVAVVLSPDAVSSPYCLKEIEFAVSLGKRLAPIRYRPVPERDLPAALKPLQLFDFNQETFEPSTAALAAALADDIDWTRQHTQIAIAARRWEVKHRPTGLLLRSPALEEAERWLAARPRRSEEPASWTRDFVTDSRRQTTRRQRRTVVMSLTAATLAIAISGFAFLQMRAAERNFVAAKTAADGLVFDFVKSLRYQKGMSQGLIRTLLQTAEQVMDRIAPETDTSSSLLLTRFELLIEFHQTYWNSGDLARAHDYGLRALRTADQLLAQTGEAGRTPDARARLYRALMQTGDSLRNGGDLDAARGSFERARDLAQAQLDGGAARGDLPCLQPSCLLLARAQARIGDVLRTASEFEDAEAHYEKARVLIDGYLAVRPGDEEWLGERSQLYNRFGDNHLRISQHEGYTLLVKGAIPDDRALLAARAGRDYERGLALRRKLYASGGQDVRRHRDVIWSLSLAGLAAMPTDPEQAITLLDEGLGEVAAALAADGDNAELLRYQALLYGFRGDAHLLRDNREAAFRDYDDGLGIRRRLAEKIDPQNARWQRDLFYTLRRYASIAQTARPEAGQQLWQQAGALLPPLLDKYRTDPVLAAAAREFNDARNVGH